MSKPALVSRIAVCVILCRTRTPEPTLIAERWFLSVCYPKAKTVLFFVSFLTEAVRKTVLFFVSFHRNTLSRWISLLSVVEGAPMVWPFPFVFS